MADAGITQTKVCTKCRGEKPANNDNFVRKLGKLTAQCKPCLRASKRAAWAANAASINEKRRLSRDDETRRKDREYYAANADRLAKRQYAWNKANPERKAELDAQSYYRNADARRKRAREYARENRDIRRAAWLAWHNQKRRDDPVYRLRASVSSYVYFCLRKEKGGKKVEQLLGYSISELRAHIERQFTRGMTWENYGEWHVDHILPVASFNFDSPDDPDFKACWALTNLRPLWADDNIRKSDKRLFLL
ncbi:hypothetical protein ACQKOE_13880 [Novosphingobium sp. NPDC080210]|uniref:hypothetical protein n=1 Tax=Novosphingobium sp. NPDC080210 TaxID=3390596 RepID=UPI003D06C24A